MAKKGNGNGFTVTVNPMDALRKQRGGMVEAPKVFKTRKGKGSYDRKAFKLSW